MVTKSIAANAVNTNTKRVAHYGNAMYLLTIFVIMWIGLNQDGINSMKMKPEQF